MKYVAILGLVAALLLVACTTQDMGGTASDIDTRQNARDMTGANNTSVITDATSTGGDAVPETTGAPSAGIY